MGRIPKIYEADVVYEVTTRIIQGRFLFKPSREANDLIVGIYGRAQTLYPSVRLYGLVVLSNHKEELLSSSEPSAIPAFIGYVNCQLSKELGALYDWPGPMFERPAKAIPIVDQNALVGRFKYLLAQGVKENLVVKAIDWPGVSCVKSLLGIEPLAGTWISRDMETRLSKLKNTTQKLGATSYVVVFSKIPGHNQLNCKEYAAFVKRLIEDTEKEALAIRQSQGTSCMGPEAIAKMNPHHRPNVIAKSPAPLCHASSKSFREEFKERFNILVSWFFKSTQDLRHGIKDVVFPPGSTPSPYPMIQSPDGKHILNRIRPIARAGAAISTVT